MLAWEMLPDCPLTGVSALNADAVVVPAHRQCAETSAELAERGYLLVEEMDCAQFWNKQKMSNLPKPSESVSPCTELPAVSAIASMVLLAFLAYGPAGAAIAVCGMMLMSAIPVFLGCGHGACSLYSWCWVLAALCCLGLKLRKDGMMETGTSRASLAASVLLLLVCAYITLSTGLPASNGLGVYGGKAKLWWCMNGFNPSVFKNSGLSALQTSYPPGFSLMIWLADSLAGGPCEYFVSLLPVLCLFVFAWTVFSVAERNCVPAAISFAVLFSFIPVATASYFYAEAVLLLLLSGAVCSTARGRMIQACFLAGMCGFVKTEGVVLTVALFAATILQKGPSLQKNNMPFLKSLSCFILSAAPAAAWYLFSRCNGASLQDYAGICDPDWNRFRLAASETFRIFVFAPWRSLYVFPATAIFIVVAMFRAAGGKEFPGFRRLMSSAVFPAACSVVYIYILSLSRAEDFSWHLRCLERLLFVPSAGFWLLAFCGNLSFPFPFLTRQARIC